MSGRMFYRTVITVTVLSEDPYPTGSSWDLGDVAIGIDDGKMVGDVNWGVSKSIGSAG